MNSARHRRRASPASRTVAENGTSLGPRNSGVSLSPHEPADVAERIRAQRGQLRLARRSYAPQRIASCHWQIVAGYHSHGHRTAAGL